MSIEFDPEKPRKPAVLITGTSSGIGRATAQRLARSGRWTVYATARKPETLTDLEGVRTLALDVEDEESMRVAVKTVTAECGAVWGLVNNAGKGEYGMLEETPLGAARSLFETNVFGLCRLIQLVLPGMRERGQGRIVNIGSIGGRFTLPGGGYYHATKHAVVALTDALRFEVQPFGIDVALVEPGAISSAFGSKATDDLMRNLSSDSPYADLASRISSRIESGFRNRYVTRPPEIIAKTVEGALSARRPKTRYVVTSFDRAMVWTHARLPDRAWDAVMRRNFG
jgi:NAD(P)-dependent dehydrogenase (short-subunit alcohol dehydrogenase family)